MLGICNGFQALVKLGLVPYGEIIGTMDDQLPHPDLQHHRTAPEPLLSRTRVASIQSPWMLQTQVGDLLHRAHLPRRGPASWHPRRW